MELGGAAIEEDPECRGAMTEEESEGEKNTKERHWGAISQLFLEHGRRKGALPGNAASMGEKDCEENGKSRIRVSRFKDL